MLRISYGSGNTKNGSTVNANATLTAPTLLVPIEALPPGFYTVTMVGIDTPYLHWISTNMPSTFKQGKDILVYEPPFTDVVFPSSGKPQRFVITLWKQQRGRFKPLPRAPRSRTIFSLPKFAVKHGLIEMSSVGFSVR